MFMRVSLIFGMILVGYGGKRFTYFQGFGTIPNSGEIDRKNNLKKGSENGTSP